jgi:hypothetical protein
MKHILYSSVFSSILMLFIMTGCKKDKSLEHTEVSPVATLFAPTNDQFIKLDAKAGSTDFQWEQARAEDGGVVLYEVVFDKTDGDFTKPLFSYPSEGNGLYNRLTLSHAELNKIAASAGIEALNSGKIKWTVRSSKGINYQQSTDVKTLELERPAGFAEIPADLYLTGAATEGGDDLAKATQFKKTATGVFEIYTMLKDGAYHFSERNTGTPKTFSVENDVLKYDGENTATGGAKVYRIRVDFNTVTVEKTEVQSIGLFLSGDNKVLFNLPYTSNGVFVATNGAVSFKQESWGRDERYKFRMAVVKADGTAGIEWFGSANSDNQPPVADTPAAYFYLFPVNNSQYDFAFKFIKAADNKNVDVTLTLNASGTYTHTVVVK